MSANETCFGQKTKHPPLLHPTNWFEKGRYDTIYGGAGDSEMVHFGNYLACLLPLAFQFARQILLSLLAQELGRALAEFRIVRQSIERIPPQKIRTDLVFFETWGCKPKPPKIPSS